MPNSLAKRAFKTTSFFSWSKAFAAIGLSGLTLLWNWWFRVRDWDTTKTFLLCVLLGYLSLTLIIFVWNLSVLGAKDWWAGFVNTLRIDLVDALKDAATQATPVQDQPDALIKKWNLSKLREFLKDKPKGSVRIVGEEGNPRAYSLSQRLASSFEDSGWTVTRGSVELGFSAQSIFVLDLNVSQMSKYSSLIREALVASGIEFKRYEMSTLEFATCTIYVTAQLS